MKRYLIIGLLVSSLVGCPGDKSDPHAGHDHDSHEGHDESAPVTTQATTETKTGH
ncbi:MAG: hypothetical protein KF878_01155 [Planctomycetes bacterium]|nr:hypothetical protein [Planctomycetota bacterium]MCW8137624.1 hypothetical protein [Planctomycetota bacterium]